MIAASCPPTAARPPIHAPIRPLADRPCTTWPANERPTDRLQALGPAALSDSELLAILFDSARIRTPVALAESLLADHGGWHGLLRRSVSEVASVPGMTTRSAGIVAAIGEIARRMTVADLHERMQIRAPADAARILMAAIGHHDQEHLVTLLLNTKNRVLKLHTVYIGTLNSSTIRISEIFKEAIRLNAAALVISHNHPSGDCCASPEDMLVNRQIVEAGKLLDIDVIDHLICSATSYTSMREKGIGGFTV